VREYDPSSEISGPPEIGELIWVWNRAETKLVQARIDVVVPIAEMLSPCDERGRSWDREVWLHPGFKIMVWVESDRLYLETRFRKDHRLSDPSATS